MGGIVKGIGNAAAPSPTFTVALPGQAQVAFPVTGPNGAVRGYSMDATNLPAQETVDRVASKFQAFYDGLPADERHVVTALLAQAAEAQQERWPG